MTDEPFLHVEMDSFLNMLPETSFADPSGMLFETVHENGKPKVIIKTGFVGHRVMRGMRHAIAALAAQGNNLIVDEVLSGNESVERQEYVRLLQPFKVFMIGVYASLETLEVRERQRGDRMIGLSRGQYETVHDNMMYDLEINTDNLTPLESALMIKRKFGL